MHFSAPSHPLIHAFLLRQEAFLDAERLIVETREQGEKLLQVLEALQNLDGEIKHAYRLISTPTDILEVMYDPTILGIFPVETLDWKVDETDASEYCLTLQKNMPYNEEKLISWLTDHGYTARKSDEIGTYFRAGDTVSVPTKKGIARISFFGTRIEDIFLRDAAQDTLRIFRID